MALTPQFESLIRRLLALTADGKINWKETANERTFLAGFARYVVTVEESGWRDNLNYTIEVSDHTGRPIEEASVSSGEWYTSLRELYVLARRQALNADASLTDLLSNLAEIR